MLYLRTVITGTGSYIPVETKTNNDFAVQNFYGEDYKLISSPSIEVVKKFKLITGIEERRYAPPNLNTSDIGGIAAKLAIEDAGIDPETLDQIIVAHNFGNIIKHTTQADTVPSLASRIKNNLGIKNPDCICYDVLFGCPGWLQGVIQAHAFFKAGMAKKILVVGTETLSRVIDIHDRDSMIFSDGAGASVMEALEGNENSSGILSTAVQSHCGEETYFINMGKSNSPNSDPRIRYIKMKGRKVYEFAIKHVPQAMKTCLEKSGAQIGDVKKIFIHQANEKMDEAIIRTMYKLFGINNVPDNIMPMNIRELGNSSVATIPTLLDMVRKGQIPDHQVAKGDIVLFASVGAGMNINAVCYRI
ncbi:MAG TPA: ketoacyl-ACP synthase III [Chitinophagaceae bacterium]|nr:ketoacyl-ACP synthase III [Chitinophagaceae bacterium]